jgi:hypothetical protein
MRDFIVVSFGANVRTKIRMLTDEGVTAVDSRQDR